VLAYLDHSATAPLRPEAAAAMLPWLTGRFGNPSGSHAVARAARTAIDEARDVLAMALGVTPGGVIFTGGGTEADNLALLGAHRPSAAAGTGPMVVTAIEHHAVLEAAAAAAVLGTEVRVVGVDADGLVDLDALAAALDRDVALVSVMLANNEVGTVQPLDLVADLVRRRAPRALLHTDAVAAMPWVDVASAAAGYDLISISAHKFGGPQGVGALAVGHGVEVATLLHGGGQEQERRSGTHNVAGIVGMAAAAGATMDRRQAESIRVAGLRDRLVDGLVAAVPGAVESGSRPTKAPGHAHLRFPGVESESLLVLLDDAGVCASAGSACASGAMEPSHVLLAMGVAPDDALGSLRLTLGPTTTEAEVDLALAAVPEAVARLRDTAPVGCSGDTAPVGCSRDTVVADAWQREVA
jgi:cysteine desulfurase